MHKLLLLACALINFKCAYACHTFNNTIVVAHVSELVPYNVTVDGCIQRQAFANRTVIKLEIVDQNVPVLDRDSVRHMVQLRAISFRNCGINTIKPGWLRNVPRLTQLEFIGNDIQEISSEIFGNSTLQSLNLRENKIDTLYDFAFDNNTRLQELDLSRNKLECWNRNWFRRVDALTTVNFEHNSIRSLPRQAFVNLRNVKNLSLSFNEISHINPRAFDGLYHLEYLGLRYNQIRLVPPDAFPIGFSMGRLDIGANKLNFLPKKLLARLSVQSITIEGNPWKCICLSKIKTWLKNNDGKMTTSAYCTGLNISGCVESQEPNFCDETVDEDVTHSFLSRVSGESQYCVRSQ